MTISFVAVASTNGLINPIVINKPTGTVEGDLMIAFLVTQAGRVVTPPAGWSLIHAVGVTHFLYKKLAGAGEGASYSFDIADAAFVAACILTYREATGITLNSGTSGSDNSAEAPSLDATGAGMLVCLYSHGTLEAMANPSGTTERIELQSPYQAMLMVCDKPIAGAGATGAQTATFTNNYWAASALFLLQSVVAAGSSFMRAPMARGGRW